MLSPFVRGLLIFGFALAAGCNSVYVADPVGLNPDSPLDAEKFNGYWKVAEGAVMLRVTNPMTGALDVAWVDEEDGKFVLKQAKATIRQWREDYLICLQDEENAREKRWVLGGRMKPGDGKMLVWPVDSKAIAAAAEGGRLLGKVADGNTMLDVPNAKTLDAITSPAMGLLLYEKPMIVTKLVE